jgi:hypothetical protein
MPSEILESRDALIIHGGLRRNTSLRSSREGISKLLIVTAHHEAGL